MKRILTVLTVFVLILTLSVPMFAAADGASWGKVPATPDKITIDAEMDPIYADALTTTVSVPAKPEYTTGAKGEAWLLWNGKDTLYIYAEIMDKEVLAPAAGASAWNTDSLEVFIDYSNANARTRDQYRIDVAGTPTYYATETVNKDKVGEYGFEKWAAKKIDGGYALEFQIKAYNEPIKAGMKIGFDLQINDMYVSGGKEVRATYHSPSKNAANGNAAKYNYIELSAEEVTVPVAKAPAASAKAPATADPMLILMAVSALAGGIVISGKRR